MGDRRLELCNKGVSGESWKMQGCICPISASWDGSALFGPLIAAKREAGDSSSIVYDRQRIYLLKG